MPSTASSPLVSPATGGKKSAYLPQLDGLRGIAILSVLIHHFDVHLPKWIDWGPIGVRTFFLLSGYLITLSVWKLGTPAEGAKDYWSGMGAFHLRRMTRLVPVLYLMLLLGVVMGLPEYVEGIGWHFAFLSNFYALHLGYWPGGASHLWSLSLQEQFYLLWPFLILIVPRKFLPWALTGFMVFALGYRVAMIGNGSSEFHRWVMLPGVIDTFALGALIACWKKSGRPIPLASGPVGLSVGVFALICYAVARECRYLPYVAPWMGVIETLENIFLGWVLLRTIEGWRGVVGWVFEMRFLMAIGRISYGLYVFHVLVHISIGPWLDRAGITKDDDVLLRTFILIVISMGVAALSYRYLEMPLAAWARRRRSGQTKPAGSVAPTLG